MNNRFSSKYNTAPSESASQAEWSIKEEVASSVYLLIFEQKRVYTFWKSKRFFANVGTQHDEKSQLQLKITEHHSSYFIIHPPLVSQMPSDNAGWDDNLTVDFETF